MSSSVNGDQVVKYNAATGKVEFGNGVSLNWIGATFIDKDGVFTGKLSAGTVKAVQLDASQITSGTVSASRIDVASLKTSLITAGNIEALTLNVTKGKIGGWSVDGDSICRGTKNNTSGAMTAASGSMTLGSNGIRGFKWRLDARGRGLLREAIYPGMPRAMSPLPLPSLCNGQIRSIPSLPLWAETALRS